MIHVSYKSELPETLTYPVNKEIISDEMSFLPDFNLLKLYSFYFSSGDIPHLKGELLYLMGVTRKMDWWSIIVRPVPHALAAEIKEAFLEQVLVKVREWLSAHWNHIPADGRCNLEVAYNVKTGAVEYTENYVY